MFSSKFICATQDYNQLYHHVSAPLFRKSFSLEKAPARAEVTIGTTGFYRLFVNGHDVTKGLLAPYIANPNHYVYYDRYDVAPYLQTGKNVLAVLLGNGHQNPIGGYAWNLENAVWRGPVRFALQLETEALSFEADESFLCAESPYDFDDLRFGVRYDARKEQKGWTLPDFDDRAWKAAQRAEIPRGEARFCEAEPIRAQYELTPKSITYVGDGSSSYEGRFVHAKPTDTLPYHNAYLYDFGVNIAGVFRLRMKDSRAGQKLRLSFGEMLFDGKFSLANICFDDNAERVRLYGDYNQFDEYTCAGGAVDFTPDFTYHGYRYVLVEGLEEGQATEDLLTCIVANSDFAGRSDFACSDEMANRIYECGIRSNFSNFYYFPTDCPHREKHGWTGDAAMSMEQMCLTMDPLHSYREWMRNICAAQDKAGALPGIVPTDTWGFAWGNGPVFDSIIAYLPYYVYKYYADTDLIRESAPAILRYLGYLESKRDEKGMVAFGLGDWIQAGHEECIQTPLEVTSCLMAMDIANKAAFLFDRAGLPHHSAFAADLARDFRHTIRTHLLDHETMTVLGRTQTAQAAALCFGVFTEEELPAAQRVLIDLAYEADVKLNVGILGTRYLFHALAQAGRADLAYRMITRTDNPSYGYMIANGATALWEGWRDLEDFQNSKNHHFFGDVMSFFIQKLVGLQPNPHLRDLCEFRIAPDPSIPWSHASASFDAPCGKVSVAWRKEADGLTLTVTAPEAAVGQILAPCGYRFQDKTAVKPLASGTYYLTRQM